jgi:macrolide-specific efflux system membrane fusion protein
MSGKLKVIIIVLIALAGAAAGLLVLTWSGGKTDRGSCALISPVRGDIARTIACTGTIEPRNRLEIKPSISGRVERILVREGDRVRSGQIVAWMSSEERAALIDAARAQGQDSVKYWEDTYKPIPLITPISGTVIVRSVEPGQSVTSATVVLVVSDRLIIRAAVDETDIGRVARGQRARVTLDAYPDVSEQGSVSHISYESTIVNNVTTYVVEIVPGRVPAVFRSGMTADVLIVESEQKDVLLVPHSAVERDGEKKWVTLQDPATGRQQRREVKTGLADGERIQILSGIAPEENICDSSGEFSLPTEDKAANPFMPGRSRKR